MAGKKEFRYKALARELAGQIRNGVYGSGQKLPSIARLTGKLGLSVNTVFRAYVELEQMGLVTARPRAGYFVSPRSAYDSDTDQNQDKKKGGPGQTFQKKRLPVYHAGKDLPAFSDQIRAAIKDPSFVPFGQAMVSPALFPGKKLAGILKSLSTREVEQLMAYGPIRGNLTLRQQLAGRLLGLSRPLSPDNLLITNGCMEAVALALMAVTRPGDTILLESPTYFGYMQILRELRLSILEIPAHPDTGIDLSALETALDTHPVKACLLSPNFQNPLGSVMPDAHKAQLVALTHDRNIPVIEDDVYSELHHGRTRPSLLQALDQKGLVVTCSSFSKTLSPGFRIGWAVARGTLLERIRQIKFSISMMTTSLDQFILAQFIDGNGYDRHLRSLRIKLKQQVAAGAQAVTTYFPRGTAVNLPQGGFVLWVRLPGDGDGMALYRKAIDEKIAVLPGSLCSFSGAFHQYIRINCGFPHTPDLENGFRRLGELAHQLS